MPTACRDCKHIQQSEKSHYHDRCSAFYDNEVFDHYTGVSIKVSNRYCRDINKGNCSYFKKRKRSLR